MKKLSLLLIFTLFSAAQLLAQRTITGTVTGDDGLGLPSVTVLVNGNIKQAAQTDIGGNYSITVPANAKFLRFSFVGMKTQDAMLTPGNTLNITLSSEASQIEGIVVTGYLTKSKNQTTGSTVQVSGNDLKNAAVTSVDQSLQGKVAGMTISTSSGTPGAGQDIRIRGAGSLSASNAPLIVLNGVPMVNPNVSGLSNSSLSSLSAISPEDIESISVLKDASTTSAYGARGSNGVIVITTKKGSSGKTAVNFATHYGFQNKAIEGRKQLTAKQKEELLIDAIYNEYGNNGLAFTKDKSLEYFLDPNNLPAKNNPNEIEIYKEWVKNNRPDNDWNKATMYKNAPIFNAQLSATGGDAESNFYMSLGYNKTQSLVVGANFKRINGALNYGRFFANKKIKISTSNSFSNTRQNAIFSELNVSEGSNPIRARYRVNPWISPVLKDGTPNLRLGSGGNYNWLYLKDNDVSFNDYTRFISNSFIEWELLKNLKYKSLFSFDYGVTNYKNYLNRVHGDLMGKGEVNESIYRDFVSVFQNSLSYNFSVEKHYFSFLGLIEYQKSKSNRLSGYGAGFTTDGLTNLNSAPSDYKADATYTDWINASYLGLLNYTFDSRYVLDFTLREEGSSRFPQGKRFGTFWSVGAAWNMQNEAFMYNARQLLNTLKLRISYGISGNSEIANNKYQALVGFSENYAGSGATYAKEVGNNDLTWEKNKTLDLGIEFGLWDNLLNGSFSYFNKLTTDLLQNVPTPATSGFPFSMKNVGSVLNTGVEGILNIQAVRKKDLKLTFNLNAATLNNSVKALAKDISGKDIIIESSFSKTIVGHPISEWFLRKWAGVNPETGNPQWYKNGIDNTGGVTEKYGEAKAELQGTSPIPKYTGGFGFQIDYKGAYLTANAYFAGGHKILEGWTRYTFSNGTNTVLTNNGVEELMGRWKNKGENTNVPKMVYTNSDGQYYGYESTRFLFKGDYIRLKDVTLGYNFPKLLLSKIRYQGTASVFIKGTNLLTYVVDKNLKYDPEVPPSGTTQLNNPPVKSIIFGINLNF